MISRSGVTQKVTSGHLVSNFKCDRIQVNYSSKQRIWSELFEKYISEVRWGHGLSKLEKIHICPKFVNKQIQTEENAFNLNFYENEFLRSDEVTFDKKIRVIWSHILSDLYKEFMKVGKNLILKKTSLKNIVWKDWKE